MDHDAESVGFRSHEDFQRWLAQQAQATPAPAQAQKPVLGPSRPLPGPSPRAYPYVTRNPGPYG